MLPPWNTRGLGRPVTVAIGTWSTGCTGMLTEVFSATEWLFRVSGDGACRLSACVSMTV